MHIFAAPWVLLCLLLLPLLPGRARFGPWLLRLVTLALLLVALAQPSLPAKNSSLGVLVDVSESVGDAAEQAAAPLAVKDGVTLEFAGDTATAAGGAQTTQPDTTRLDTAQLNAGQLDTLRNRTDIGRALQVGAATGRGAAAAGQ